MSKRHRKSRLLSEVDSFLAEQPDPHGDLWVRSDVMPDGSYAVTVSAGTDAVRVFTPEEATRYALTCFAACQRAEFDHAVASLLLKTGVDEDHAAAFVALDLRPDRPPLDDSTTTPLTLHPGFSRRRPFVDLHLNGEPWAQVGVPELRAHAIAVLEAPYGVDLDEALYRKLRSTIDLSENTARAVVHDVAHFRA